jgi:hypothetical protein
MTNLAATGFCIYPTVIIRTVVDIILEHLGEVDLVGVEVILD